jgi:predicted AAA+ superfamily ATPase
MDYIPRSAEVRFRTLLTAFPCLALTGPRQSGKSTLIRRLLPDRPYVSFDDPSEELAFREDPRGFMARFPDDVVFDEVQRVPDLLRYIKLAIDAGPARPGRFVLSGSNQLLLTKGLSESLAGRVGLMDLLPFETAELPPAARPGQALNGSYPGLLVYGAGAPREWFASYLATYLEKDIRAVAAIGDLTDFQRLVRLAAIRSSQELNFAGLARDIGVAAKTVAAWLSVMEAGYIVHRLEPWFANIRKRIVKRPKAYFWDTGLLCHLAGVRDREALDAGPLGGPVFETLVVSELRKRALHRGAAVDFWYYRDNGGNEIDLIVQDRAAGRLAFVEIKAAATPKTDWANRLERAAAPLLPALTADTPKVEYLIVYRGASRRAWPRPGIDWRNWDELALTGLWA